jgi:hypothetical protein
MRRIFQKFRMVCALSGQVSHAFFVLRVRNGDRLSGNSILHPNVLNLRSGQVYCCHARTTLGVTKYLIQNVSFIMYFPCRNSIRISVIFYQLPLNRKGNLYLWISIYVVQQKIGPKINSGE